MSEDDLRTIFSRFGEIIYTKIPLNKGCGFVQFVARPAAEAALAQMQGQVPLLPSQHCSHPATKAILL